MPSPRPFPSWGILFTPKIKTTIIRIIMSRNPEDNPLYGVVSRHLEIWLVRQNGRERPVPRFVERELRAFLDCGVLAKGFLRVHCDACGKDRVVAFSCKGRSLCSSCCGRRMADTAAHLVDRVLPEVPFRQWVLSLPFPLRYRFESTIGKNYGFSRLFPYPTNPPF
jgi:hypothetical protein